MDDKARLQLQKMIQANNVEDQTELIRQLKHSELLKSDVASLVLLKSKYGDDMETIMNESMIECSFLFTYYTDIYNKIRKDEIDMTILFDFLNILEQIEKGELDQHEGSFAVGTLLKKLYIDSALKKSAKLDAQYETVEERAEPIDISWSKFKNARMQS